MARLLPCGLACQPSNSAMSTEEMEAGYKTKRQRRGKGPDSTVFEAKVMAYEGYEM